MVQCVAGEAGERAHETGDRACDRRTGINAIERDRRFKTHQG